MREISTDELKQLQLQGKKILVDYKAKWCSPCKQLVPRLTNMAKDFHDVDFVMVDVDENKDGCMEVGIRSVPTVMIYNGNTLIDRSTGANADSYYKEILNNL
jgi:thioredoxin